MAIRVLRLIEYVYGNEEVAAEDMARWTVTAAPRRGIVMRSATLPFEAWPDWPEVVIPVVERGRVRAIVRALADAVAGPLPEGQEMSKVEEATAQLMEIFNG